MRRAAAEEGLHPSARVLGALFEQFVGLELLWATRQAEAPMHLRFWRDPDGPEVDWVVVWEDRWLPVEVKWSEAPTGRDARHLETFLSEYPKARAAVVVCRTPKPFKLAEKITAIPCRTSPPPWSNSNERWGRTPQACRHGVHGYGPGLNFTQGQILCYGH